MAGLVQKLSFMFWSDRNVHDPWCTYINQGKVLLNFTKFHRKLKYQKIKGRGYKQSTVISQKS